MIEGLDVSRYEKVKSWEDVKAAGGRFVAIRATVGDYYTDLDFSYNWQYSKAVGLLRSAYHVLAPEISPDRQIDRLFACLGADLGELPITLDVELERGVGAKQVIDHTHGCLELITQRSGRKPLLYTSPGFANEWLSPTPSWIGEYPLWVAHYTMNKLPMLPRGCNSWMFWQYSEHGKVSGVEGEVDLDRFYGTADQLEALSGGHEVPPQPPVPPLTIEERMERIEREARKHGWAI